MNSGAGWAAQAPCGQEGWQGAVCRAGLLTKRQVHVLQAVGTLSPALGFGRSCTFVWKNDPHL